MAVWGGPARAQFVPPSQMAAIEAQRFAQTELIFKQAVRAAVRQQLEQVGELRQLKARFQPSGQFTQLAQARMLPTPPSPARNGEPTIEECEHWLASAERRYGIPPYLLHAIAVTESGRRNRPNPYAMNIGGRSYFANSTADMERVVILNGTKSNIDLGCMQVSLKHHGKKFTDWRSLLNPRTNVEYGAWFLRSLAKELGSWEAAVGAYHSRTSWRSANYRCLVSIRYGRFFGIQTPKGKCGPALSPMITLAARYYRWQPQTALATPPNSGGQS